MQARSGLLSALWQGNTTHRQMLLVLVGIWVLLVLTHLTPCAKTDTDTGANLALGKSLAEGEGYKLEGRFCRVYPPLFPMALSLAHSVNWPGYVFEKLLVMLTALGVILCSYLFLKQRYEGRELTILALLTASSPALLEYSFRIRPDVPFTVLVLVFILAAARYWCAPRVHWPWALTAAVALPLATLTRSAGVALYLASAVWLMRFKLWRRDARRCIVFAVLILVIACPPVFGWACWLKDHKGEGTGSYANMFIKKVPKGNHPLSTQGLALLAKRWARTVPEQVYAGARSLMSSGKGVPAMVWTWLVVPVLLLGLIRRLREPEFSEYCFCAYGILILLWPSPQGFRFWLPVLPLTWGYVADGVRMLGHLAEEYPRLGGRPRLKRLDASLGWARERWLRWAVLFLLALALVSSGTMVVESWRACGDAINHLVLGKSTRPIAQFAQAEGDRDIVLAHWRGFEIRPAVTNPRSKIVGIHMRADDDMASFMRRLSETGVTHLAIDHRNIDPIRKRGLILDHVKNRLLADSEKAWLAEETRRVRIFHVPPAVYWTAATDTPSVRRDVKPTN